MEKREERGAVKVGMAWGGASGVLGFVAALFSWPVGLVVGGVVGYLCGRRAALEGPGRPGALSGLISGAVAVPVYAVGITAGILVVAQLAGPSRYAAELRDVSGMELSADGAWLLFLAGVFMLTVVQAAIFVGAATVAGALAERARGR